MLFQHDSSHISLGLQIPGSNRKKSATCHIYNQLKALKVFFCLFFYCKLASYMLSPLCILEMKLYGTCTHAHTYEYPQCTPAQAHLHNDTMGCWTP